MLLFMPYDVCVCQVPRHDGKADSLGLTVLDEPCAKQSDPHVLDLKLRSVTKQTTTKQMVGVQCVSRY